MSSTKQTSTPADFDKVYEQNDIGLKGILGFGIGLLLLILVTFVLMWAFLGSLRQYSKDSAEPANPMAMTDKERLPPEPRIQAAPGFGVDSEKGRVNLELMAPQSEYRELRKQWDELRDKGQVDAKTGMVAKLPIAEAKERFLSQNVKARSGPDGEEVFRRAHMFMSDASSGRIASETRR